MVFNLDDASHTVSQLEFESQRRWSDVVANSAVFVRALFYMSVFWGCADNLGTIHIDAPEMPEVDGAVTTDGFVPADRDGSPITPTTDGGVPSSDATPTDGELPASDMTVDDRDGALVDQDAQIEDGGPVEPDATPPQPDANVPEPDANVPEPDANVPEPDAQVPPTVSCEPAEVFQRNGCLGCHGAAAQGSLDLRTVEGRRFADAPAQAEGCQSRKLIDVNRPSHSLILQVVGATEPPAGAADSCQLVMPPQPAALIPQADRDCLNAWAVEVADDFRGEDPPEQETQIELRTALQKVKTILRGSALSEAELFSVQSAADERTGIEALVRDWAQGPEFERKLQGFLKVALQQQLQGFQAIQFDRLNVNRAMRERLIRVMEESFVRTAMDLIERDQPFNRVANTETWMVTTANLILLKYADQSAQARQREHRVFSNPSDAAGTLRGQINQRRWLLQREEIGECTIPQFEMLKFIFGLVRRRRCENHSIPGVNFRYGINDTVLTEEDFNDWRLVTFELAANTPESELIPFYDVRRLRTATSVKTRVPRVGYFTTNAFFENWMTNSDNQFRVAVNQSLLAGLHTRFSATEPTVPLRTDGVDGEHASNADCMGCHKQVDPMRAYFAKSYNISYQRPFGDGADGRILPGMQSAFTFYGRRNEGGNLRRFGRLIAQHPKFASAWLQKLCLFTNSARCDVNDPEFRAIERQFVQSGFKFKEMMVSLLSSPLITGLGVDTQPAEVSISRRDHLCATLAVRTGRDNICETRRVRQIIGLIPNDAIARGDPDPSMPTLPNPVYLATAEAVCEAVAQTVVTNNQSARFSGARPTRTIGRVVNQLMGLAGHSTRANATTTILTEHFNEARSRGASQLDAVRSVFTVGCLSPDVTGVGL